MRFLGACEIRTFNRHAMHVTENVHQLALAFDLVRGSGLVLLRADLSLHVYKTTREQSTT